MAVTAFESGEAAAPAAYPPRSAVISWIFFDWAAQPYFTLITTFVFAPYFATHVAPDAAEGQALWGFATAAAGMAIALASPVLGAIADASGRRKPWIAAFGAMLVIGASLMWFGRPGDPGVITLLLLCYAIATVGVEFATVFNNAMMPTLVPPERIGRLSGTGWATGYIGGILSLILVLGFLAANPESGRTLFGFTPLFGLDPLSHQGDRISGPLTGIWFVVFVLPMFLLTPDYPARRSIRDAIGEGLAELKQTLRELPRHRSLAAFLLANMIYTDGLADRHRHRGDREPEGRDGGAGAVLRDGAGVAGESEDQQPCRPGQASACERDPGPITTASGFAKAGATARCNNNALWLWVPAFAGTTVEDAAPAN